MAEQQDKKSHVVDDADSNSENASAKLVIHHLGGRMDTLRAELMERHGLRVSELGLARCVLAFLRTDEEKGHAHDDNQLVRSLPSVSLADLWRTALQVWLATCDRLSYSCVMV